MELLQKIRPAIILHKIIKTFFQITAGDYLGGSIVPLPQLPAPLSALPVTERRAMCYESSVEDHAVPQSIEAFFEITPPPNAAASPMLHQDPRGIVCS